jgi:hypothetical protein
MGRECAVQSVGVASTSNSQLKLPRPKPYGAWYMPTKMWNSQRQSDEGAAANGVHIHFTTVEQVGAAIDTYANTQCKRTFV